MRSDFLVKIRAMPWSDYIGAIPDLQSIQTALRVCHILNPKLELELLMEGLWLRFYQKGLGLLACSQPFLACGAQLFG